MSVYRTEPGRHHPPEHFRRGGNFALGGNIGLAAARVEREAYGALSVSGGACGTTTTSDAVLRDDEYNVNASIDENQVPQSMAIAPIVAYAKFQGLYAGVSLEGSRIFSRDVFVSPLCAKNNSSKVFVLS